MPSNTFKVRPTFGNSKDSGLSSITASDIQTSEVSSEYNSDEEDNDEV
jgi:hypothetical protein